MDNLVLIRVAAALGASLDRATVLDVHQDAPNRIRLMLRSSERVLPLVISTEPGSPWIGRPAGRSPGRSAPGPFVALCARRLHGAILAGVQKPVADRRVALTFADGQSLMAELAGSSANLVLLDGAGRVVSCLRRSRSGSRLVPGEPYRAPEMPPGRIDPFTSAREDLEVLPTGPEQRETVALLLRELVGLGRTAAELICGEARLSGRAVATVLSERLASVLRGEVDPVVEAPGPPLELALAGRLAPGSCRLLPWTPETPRDPLLALFRGSDPAETAGLYHEAIDVAQGLRERGQALLALLDREIRKNRDARAKVALDLAGFADPERHRRSAEALLAGLATARRSGDHVLVPDPYDEGGTVLSIEVRGGQSLTAAADQYFERHRRALRGLDRATQRAERLAEHGRNLARLREASSVVADEARARELERAMQHEGIPVGLEAPRSRRAASIQRSRSRIEGVRLFVTSDGAQALVGKSGKDNQRLTFRLAGPEDFWFHARDVPGAHVVVRNEERKSRPGRASLEEAARAAAWFSEARSQGAVDVQWTRRKYVRKARGAPPGTVIVKRFETVRVAPAAPRGLTEAP